MALVGWPLGSLHDDTNDKFLQSLAGNAFSALSVGIMLLGIIAGLDTTAADDFCSDDEVFV